MSSTGKTKYHVKQVATESLHMLAKVAEIANGHRARKGIGTDSFASVYSLNTTRADLP